MWAPSMSCRRGARSPRAKTRARTGTSVKLKSLAQPPRRRSEPRASSPIFIHPPRPSSHRQPSPRFLGPRTAGLTTPSLRVLSPPRSRRGDRVAEGTRLLSGRGAKTPPRVRIPPSPLQKSLQMRALFFQPPRRRERLRAWACPGSSAAIRWSLAACAPLTLHEFNLGRLSTTQENR
jgi:hypothetical protein